MIQFKNIKFNRNYITGSAKGTNGDWFRFKYNRKTYEILYILDKNISSTDRAELRMGCRDLNYNISSGLVKNGDSPSFVWG